MAATSTPPVRGAVAFDGKKMLRFEVSEQPGAAKDCGFLWCHGLTSSMRCEGEGGWPFAWIPALGSLMPVARYDARGHGESDAAADTSWPAMGRDMRRLRQAWGKPRTVLGGTSMGCAASLYAALEDPDISGLVLANPPTCYDAREKFKPMYEVSLELAQARGLEEAKRMNAAKTRPPIFLESEAGRALFDAGWDTKFEMGLERYLAALRGAMVSDLPSPERLASIQTQTLIIAWKSDVQHPVATAKMLHAMLPNSELCIAESWSEIEEELPRRTRAFLNRLVSEV